MSTLRQMLATLRAHRLWQPLAYLVVGGWNTLFGVGIYALAYALLHARFHYLVLLVACNILAITNAYICYKHFVFRTRGNWLREYLRFYAVYGLAMLLGMGLVVLLVRFLGMHPVVANIVTTLVTIVCSFFGHKHVSFAPAQPRAPDRSA
jgi:putative flippase GtrA